MSSFSERVIGAARLDPEIYEEVEADTDATGQALGVVLLASIAAGIGSMGAGGLVIGTVASLIGWFLWAGLTAFLGTRVLPGPETESDIGELLRTTGFSASPGILRIFGVVPLIGPVVNVVVAVWMLAAMVIAVRQALDYEGTGRAIAVCVIGWLVYACVIAFFAAGIAVSGT